MYDFFTEFQTFLWLVVNFVRLSGKKLIQPALTAVCLTAAYTAVHVGQEGSVVAGLKSAFLDSATARLERRRFEDATMLQAELHEFAAANKLINQMMETILARAGGASRVWLSVIHNGVTGLTGTGLLRYDDTNGVAVPGRVAALAVTNQPLSDWSDFLPTLLAGQCSYHRSAELQGLSLRARLESIGVTGLLACPVADVQGKTVGALFVLWDGSDQPPNGEELKELTGAVQHQGGQIAAVLDLRGPSPIIPTLLGN